jgi:hypothetical protein
MGIFLKKKFWKNFFSSSNSNVVDKMRGKAWLFSQWEQNLCGVE